MPDRETDGHLRPSRTAQKAEDRLESYDYIVVGAGSAGCVVARRLSDDPAVRVLLLEAGPPARNFWLKVPAGMAPLFRSERYNWRFMTEPEPKLRDRRMYWPRGKVLGGSGAINGLAHVRGHRRDFDHWAQLGNTGWGWDGVLPYFQRSEDNDRGPGQGRGVGGPLPVTNPMVIHPAVTDFIESTRRLGVPLLDDLEAGDNDGVGLSQFNIRKGVRQSSYDVYVKPVEGRPNLVVRPNVHVRRIQFDGHTATGVELTESGLTRSVQATREVVVAAGALQSPHLLMLSGVGDGDMLRDHGVPLLHHSPGVGKNLQDHFNVRVQMGATPGSSYNADLRGWRKYWQGMQYVLFKQGYLTLGNSPAAAFLKSHEALDYADLEISFRPMTFGFDAQGNAAVDSYDAMASSIYRVRPASRGEVRLRSPDPMENPAFQPNFLSDPEDITATISGIRLLRRIMETEPLKSRVVKELTPGGAVETDEQLLDYMEREGQCAFHPAGTCKMGRDPMAVVDERLRVRGIERLRVIDASIMPVVTSGNTNAPTVMIGEKGAEMMQLDAVPARPVAAS